MELLRAQSVAIASAAPRKRMLQFDSCIPDDRHIGFNKEACTRRWAASEAGRCANFTNEMGSNTRSCIADDLQLSSPVTVIIAQMPSTAIRISSAKRYDLRWST